MTTLNRLLWYQSMSASDISELLSADEMREYLRRRHPTGKKSAERPEKFFEIEK